MKNFTTIVIHWVEEKGDTQTEHKQYLEYTEDNMNDVKDWIEESEERGDSTYYMEDGTYIEVWL